MSPKIHWTEKSKTKKCVLRLFAESYKCGARRPRGTHCRLSSSRVTTLSSSSRSSCSSPQPSSAFVRWLWTCSTTCNTKWTPFWRWRATRTLSSRRWACAQCKSATWSTTITPPISIRLRKATRTRAWAGRRTRRPKTFSSTITRQICSKRPEAMDHPLSSTRTTPGAVIQLAREL